MPSHCPPDAKCQPQWHLWGRFRTARAQRQSLRCSSREHPCKPPPPLTEVRMIHSKRHRGCRIQGPGTQGYRRWKIAACSHSARTAHGALPVTDSNRPQPLRQPPSNRVPNRHWGPFLSDASLPLRHHDGGRAQRAAPPGPSKAKPEEHATAQPRPPEGMLSYCTWAQDAASTKTQKENRLVSGLKDHRCLSVTRMRHRGASGQATNTQSNGSQRYVMNHRQAGTIGPELLTTYRLHK